MDGSFASAIDAIPAGRWAVGVSGGGDSVALLAAACDRRPDLFLHVVHVNHQLRDQASDGDERFVVELARSLGRPCTVWRADAIAPARGDWPGNRSARYRAMRFEAFARVVADHTLGGILLAHHADDVAETVLLRLRRGSGVLGLAGVRDESRVGSLRVLHPLRGVRRETLRADLLHRGHAWREDASNASHDFARNRVRQWLAAHPAAVGPLLSLGDAADEARAFLERSTPTLGESFDASELADRPDPIARHAARRWLASAGVPSEELSDRVCDRLLAMARDASVGRRRDFPGITVVRQRRRITAARGPDATRDG